MLSEYNSNNISYVLLVGEANEVAPGVGTVGAASGETSDPIYSLLAGGDNYPDIFIGRFSAGSAARVDVQAAKSVKYERDPQIGGAWYGRASGLASSEGSPADSTRMNWVRDTLLYYEYDRVDKIHQPSATSAQIRDSVNAGRGLINYLGHGSTTSWSNPPFSVTNVNELTNNNLLPIVNSVACVVGDFAGTATCFCEAWQWAGTPEQPRGSVVHYGSSINQSWVPPTISQMEANRLLAQRKRVTAGGFFFNGSIRMMEYYGAGGDGDDMFQTWHIFGDASVPIRSDLPAELSVTHANIVSLGSNVPFAVQVARQSGGQPVAGALVCALSRSDSSVQAAGYTDASGNATLNITNSNPDTIWVTVTGHNLAPYLGHAMAAVPANVSIVPDHIPVNTTTAVTVTVTESEPPYNGIDSIVVTISGLGVNPALVETTDASGSAGFSVHPLYGELLSVTGRRIGEGFDMFRDTIWVTGGANYDLVDLLVGVPEIALYDTVAPNFGGLFEGHLEPPGYTMFITGCGIDTSATTAGEYLPIIATPTSSGSIIGAIAKAGYNVYIKNIICKQVYGTLSGTVTDDATALPLAGVRVVGLAGADTAFDV
ncbi:MAG TPA: hypothetical protein DDW31_03790, partial [candidate division Zixibacteria bacterium]|nr:hypothetical protein [candidate division Zixibacteria bacterium]